MGQRLPKANSEFGKLTDSGLIARAQAIHDGMVANVAIFPTPPITMLLFQGFIDNFKSTSATAVKGSKVDTALKSSAKSDLINNMRSIVTYINQVIYDQYQSNTSNLTGYRYQILLSGAGLAKEPNPAANNVGLGIPIIHRAISNQAGSLSILLRQYERWKRGTKVWQVQYRTSAIPGTVPVPAGEWISDTFTSGNINITGLESGKYYDYQIAAVGGRDVKLNNENPMNWTRLQSIVII